MGLTITFIMTLMNPHVVMIQGLKLNVAGLKRVLTDH